MPARSLGLLGLALALAACASSGPQLPPGAKLQVTASRAPFYKYGPAQTFGADDMLAFGTPITLLQRSMGFSRVMQANGTTGYISNDEIGPAIAEKLPAPGTVVTNRKIERVFSAPIKRSAVKPTPGDPLFDVSDVPLPMKDEPKPPANAAHPDAPPLPEKEKKPE